MRRARGRLVAAAALTLLSVPGCGREVTSPGGGLSAPMAIAPSFRGDAAQAALASGIPVAAVRVVLTRTDGTAAVDRAVQFPSADSLVTLSLSVPLSDRAGSQGEPFALTLAFANAAGDTVFRGGPLSVLAVPGGSSAPPQPVTVPTTYTGPGSQATRVVIAPDTVAVLDGGAFTFTAQAFDGQGAVVANAPVLFYTLDSARVTVSTAGVGAALAVRGAARVVATLLTTGADTGIVVVSLRPSGLAAVSGGGQTGVAGSALAQPVVARVTASDGQPVAGVTVTFAASAGGAPGASTVVTDANGLASTTWTLGAALGAQSMTATAAGLAGSPLTFGATATAGAPSQLAFIDEPASTDAVSTVGTVAVAARDAQGNLVASYTGPVTVALGANPGNATLAGSLTANAVAGVATFNDLVVNRPAAGYTLVATGGALAPATSAAFTVGAGSAAALAFGTQPSNVTEGIVMAPAVTVEARDAAGNLAVNFTGAVTLAFGANPGAAALGGTLSRAAVAGVASFNDLTISAAGTGYTLVATATGTSPATSLPFSTSTATINWINPAGGSWRTAANWSLGRIPAVDDIVVIDAAGTYTVLLDSAVTVAGLQLGGATGAQTLDVAGVSLSLTGDAAVAPTGQLQLRNGSLAGGAGIVLDLAGTLAMAGTPTVSTAINTLPGARIRALGGALGIGVTTATFTLGLVNRGALEVEAFGGWSAGVAVTGGALVNEVGATIAALGSGGARTLTATLDNRGTVVAQTPLTIDGGGAAHLHSGTFSAAGGDIAVVQSGGGASLASSGTIEIQAGRTFTVSGGSMTMPSGAFAGTGTLALTGTTAAITPALTGDLAATSATVFLQATLAANAVTLTNASMNGPGTIAVGAGRSMTVSGGSVSAPVVNAGTITLVGAPSLAGGLTTQPGSLIRVLGGTLGIGPTTATIATALTNAGTIELEAFGGWSAQLAVTGGTLANTAGGVIRAMGTGGARTLLATVDNAGTIDVDYPLALTTSGAASASTGTVTAQGGVLTWTLAGAGASLTVSGGVDLGTGAGLTVSGGTSDFTAAATLSGAGTLRLTATDAVLATAPAATMALEVTGGVTAASAPIGVTSATFTNATITASAGVQVAAGRALTVINGTLGGAVDVQGAMSLVGSAQLTGPLTTGTASVVRVLGGTLGIGETNATIANGFTNLNDLEFETFGGWGARLAVPGGTLVNANGATIRSQGSGGLRRLSAQLVNDGLIETPAPLTVDGADAAHVLRGTVTVSGGDLTLVQSGAAPSLSLEATVGMNAGRTLAVTGGAVQVTAAATTSGGTLALTNAASTIADVLGSSLVTSGGTLQLDAPLAVPRTSFTNTVVTGTGSISGGAGSAITVVNGAVGPPIAAADTLTLVGTTTLSGALTTAPTTRLRVFGGTLGVGPTAITVASGFTSQGTLDLQGFGGWQAGITVQAGALVNEGTLTSFAGSGPLTITGTFTNAPAGTLRTDGGLTISTTSAQLRNEGTIDVLGGDLAIALSGVAPAFLHLGTANIAAGRTLRVTGGTATFDPAGVVLGGGTLELVGATSQLRAIAPSLIVSGGALTLTDTVAVPAVSLTNTTVDGVAFRVDPGRSLTAGNSAVSAGIDVQGTLVLLGNSTLSGPVLPATGSTIRVTSGALGIGGTAATIATGNGLFSLGTLELDANGGWPSQLTVTGGTLFLSAGGTLRTVGNAGSRTLVANVNNQGVIELSPGVVSDLAINGTFANSGELRFELGSNTSYDRILVNSTIGLSGGALRAATLGGYTPSAGTTFTLMQGTARTGEFATSTLPAGFSPVGYSATSVFITRP